MSKRTQADAPALYSHPFSASYWRTAAKDYKNLRSLVIAALLCALAIVIEKFQIPLGGPSLQVSLSFFVIALCSMLTGPLLAILCGILVDLIGIIGSGYPFFAGYTLTAVLTAVIFALFLYRTRPTFTRILLARGVINLFVNTLLGSVWRVALYHGPYKVYVLLSGVKNLVFLPLEVALLCVFFRAMFAPLRQMGFLPPEAEVTYRNRDIKLLTAFALIGVALIIPYAIWYDEIQAFLKGLF